jgi:hypothetical protein
LFEKYRGDKTETNKAFLNKQQSLTVRYERILASALKRTREREHFVGFRA